MNLAKKRRLMYQDLETVISYVENRKKLIDKRMDEEKAPDNRMIHSKDAPEGP